MNGRGETRARVIATVLGGLNIVLVVGLLVASARLRLAADVDRCSGRERLTMLVVGTSARATVSKRNPSYVGRRSCGSGGAGA